MFGVLFVRLFGVGNYDIKMYLNQPQICIKQAARSTTTTTSSTNQRYDNANTKQMLLFGCWCWLIG